MRKHRNESTLAVAASASLLVVVASACHESVVQADAPKKTIATSAPPAAAPGPAQKTEAEEKFHTSIGLADEAGSLRCKASDKTYFSCKTRRKANVPASGGNASSKGASSGEAVVCGDGSSTPPKAILFAFRDGSSPAEQYVVPDSAFADVNRVRYARYTRPLVTYLHVAWGDGGKHEVFAHYNEEAGQKHFSSGLIIHGLSDEEWTCVGAPDHHLMDLEDALPL